jgi:uncharacterized membrane protein (UPF0127 family)
MKHGIVILIVVVIVALALIVSYNQISNQRSNESQVCFRDNCFYVELALTPEEQSRGLMFRDHLDPDRGMLFVFPKEDVYSFWMKNTLVPLDIIWIDKDKKIVFINTHTPPCTQEPCPSIDPQKEALYVLEINAGISDQIGLSVGDQATIDYI